MKLFKMAFALSMILLPTHFYCDKVLAQSPVAAETSDTMMPLSLIPRWNKESPWIVDGRVVDNQKRACPKANVALIAELHTNSIHWAMEELAYDRDQKLSTDKDGNIVFPLLIPGAQYVLYTYNAGKDRMFFKECKRFKVASGQQVDLGTVVARRN
jgi:hypothetical protein